MKNTQDKALEIAQLLEDGKGEDVVVINISELNSWTDYFVIATVNSSTHWQGLYRQVKEYIKENDLEIHLTNKKSPDGDDWNLIDLGNIVVHLMSKQARDFYDLEKLWHNGTKLDYKGMSNDVSSSLS
ncbi:MAG: ribosome silencing factor [Treponema sp.]|uniref:ribosome silencing factor n=1 Tax=Treponema sp. TaxID=166 RepID=UPI001B653725|nr:ribosome silencing factor [Treponema sp.]MBP5403334.1 ribosome silencing factor [Treponema sp.]MBR5932624.1 ribosome silencing factor [Treponema sp.]